MRLGILHQRFPFLLVHPLGVASLCPVDLLTTVSNQSNGSFDSNLQIVLSIGQSKVFLGKKALDKLGEDLQLRLLGEEVREEARKGSPCIGNIGVRQIPVQLKD